MPVMKAIRDAIERAGGPAKAAELLRCSVQAVYFWREGKRQFPAEHCPSLEAATGVTCEELRPDVSWSVLRGTAKKAARPHSRS